MNVSELSCTGSAVDSHVYEHACVVHKQCIHVYIVCKDPGTTFNRVIKR